VLRHEVKRFNIQVSLVEPAYIKTNLWQTRQYPVDRISDYDPWRHRTSKATKQYQGKAPDPRPVAECILHIIETKSPRLRYVVGKRAALAFRLRRFLPESQYEKVVRRLFQLDIKK
jgi:short-subunit dehydrogenase